MVLRLIRKYNCTDPGFLDYQLVDLLRVLYSWDYPAVIGRQWAVTELDMETSPCGNYGPEALAALFPEVDMPEGATAIQVDGERLLERSAVVHQFESGLWLRVVDPNVPVIIRPDLHLYRSPDYFQATNVDLEIRCDEACPYEIMSMDGDLITVLQSRFAKTELLP